MLARIDSRELTEWMAYERIAGPLGGRRGDIQAAIVATTVANSGRGKKGRKPKLTDFLPPWSKPEKRPQTPEEHYAAIVRLNAQLGGAVIKTPDPDP